jgi:hypothetical protein
MLPCSCQQDLDTNFGEEELERIKNRPKLTINTFLNKLSSITHADESYFIVAEDVSNDSPPHRTLWNKITNKITKEREGKGEDGKKVSLFRVGLDNSFISSVVESIVVNRKCMGSSKINKLDNGTVLCIPMHHVGHDYPFGVCYFVRNRKKEEETIVKQSKGEKICNNDNENNKDRIETINDVENKICSCTNSLNKDGIFHKEIVSRCQKIVEQCGEKYIYRALKRKQRPTSARASHIMLAKEHLDMVLQKKRKKRFTAKDIYRELKLQILSKESPRCSRDTASTNQATMGPPPPKLILPKKIPKKEIDVTTIHFNRMKKRKKKKQRIEKIEKIEKNTKIDISIDSNQSPHSKISNIDVKEPWKTKYTGVRQAQSAAVHVKNRLTIKKQARRPSTLAGYSNRTKGIIEVGSGLSGRRKGFMSWIHGAVKLQKKGFATKNKKKKNASVLVTPINIENVDKQSDVLKIRSPNGRKNYHLQKIKSGGRKRRKEDIKEGVIVLRSVRLPLL